LWYGLLARGSWGAGDPDWFGDIVGQDLRFKRVMKKLLAYSLAGSHRDRESYWVHPVVHDWCLESISRGRLDLIMLALKIVGFATPTQSESAYGATQQRFLPAFYGLGFLYADQGKLAEAEKMYQRALDGKEKAWGPEHISFDDMIEEANIKTWVKANLEEYKEKLRPRDPNGKKYPK
ncbi:MAG: hypothetical protein Q9221_009097, partial [Calogaya cf. arnoldii]